jgi:glycosyltransferase involved in cell wall biosynthesis
LFISNVGFELPRSSLVVTPACAKVRACEPQPRLDERLRIVYCGNVDYSRGLDILVSAVDGMPGRAQLTIYGGGVALEAFQQLPTSSSNIHFGGPFRNADLAELALGHDLFWAAYDLSVPNNRYCDPNKFRDHIIVDMPIITNPGHPLADLVERSGSGFVVPLEAATLKRFLGSLARDVIAARKPSRVGAEAMLLSVVEANKAAGKSLVRLTA